MLITIDGPAGVGKTSVAKGVANALGLKAVSTGALYRAIGYAVIKSEVNINDKKGLEELLRSLKLSQRYLKGEIRTFLNDEDITEYLESPEVSDMASKVAEIPLVREYLLDVQREIAGEDAVVEGRDIGSVVLPYADIKIYLDASLMERAKRRYKQLTEKGLNIKFEDILRDLRERDLRDKSRKTAPLVIPKDAFYIDTTYMSLNEVINRILKIIRSIAYER